MAKIDELLDILVQAKNLTSEIKREQNGNHTTPPNTASYTDKEKQNILKEHGYYRIGVDGIWGQGSAKAEADFMKANNMKVVNYSYREPSFIQNYFLSQNQYFSQVYEKKQIVLHHTAGSRSATNTANFWNGNIEAVATDFIIDGDGTIIRVIPKGYWAWHLGVGRGDLDSAAIGIEICAYGYLYERGGLYYNAYGGIVSPEEVERKQFKGFQYFQTYTEKQIESLGLLLKYLQTEYSIPFSYSDSIFAYSEEAMAGKKGIYTHNSFKQDKTDIYPAKNIVSLLKSL